MQCPDCESRVRGNFCSSCGRQLPYLVGASYPYGIQFPALEKSGPLYQAAVGYARAAPRYIRKKDRHQAFYDLHSLRRLLELDAVLKKLFRGRQEAVFHTATGKTFHPGPMPWGCFAARVEKKPATGTIYPHTGKCFSYFGCLHAQDRQSPCYHADGKEVFWDGIHGSFEVEPSERRWYGAWWPQRFRRLLERSVWRFDKKAVRQEVVAKIKRYGAHRCPFFSARHLDMQIDLLPDTLIPAQSPGWGVEESPDHWPGVFMQCYAKPPTTIIRTALGGVERGNNDGGDCHDQ